MKKNHQQISMFFCATKNREGLKNVFQNIRVSKLDATNFCNNNSCNTTF